MPRRNVVPKPASMSFEEAACLPTAWLTAYRMLFTRGGLKAGDTVLVQGAGGGVATACIILGRAAGLKVLATSRDEAKRARALEIGAQAVLKGTQVDGVYDSDPQRNPDAVKFDKLNYNEVLTRGLKVMDATAVSLCMDNGMPIVVFNLLPLPPLDGWTVLQNLLPMRMAVAIQRFQTFAVLVFFAMFFTGAFSFVLRPAGMLEEISRTLIQWST